MPGISQINIGQEYVVNIDEKIVYTFRATQSIYKDGGINRCTGIITNVFKGDRTLDDLIHPMMQYVKKIPKCPKYLKQ